MHVNDNNFNILVMATSDDGLHFMDEKDLYLCIIANIALYYKAFKIMHSAVTPSQVMIWCLNIFYYTSKKKIE